MLRLTAFALAMAASAAAAAATVAGVYLPAVQEVSGHRLALISCGLRNTLWIEHYVAAVYAPPQVSASAAIQDPAQPKMVQIVITESMFLPGDIPAPWNGILRAELPHDMMQGVEFAYSRLAEGDVVRVTYLPESGLAIEVNGRLVGQVAGHAPLAAIVQAWAEREPVGAKLHDTLSRHPCGGSATETAKR